MVKPWNGTRIFPAMVKPWNCFVKSSLLNQKVKLKFFFTLYWLKISLFLGSLHREIITFDEKVKVNFWNHCLSGTSGEKHLYKENMPCRGRTNWEQEQAMTSLGRQCQALAIILSFWVRLMAKRECFLNVHSMLCTNICSRFRCVASSI